MRVKFTLHSLQKRILSLAVIISFIFCALILKLGVVQIINGAALQARAAEQWTRDLPLVAERGKIFDRTGASLAVSYMTYSVYTRSRQIKDPVTVAKFLSNILKKDYKIIYDKVIYSNISEVLIEGHVSKEDGEKIIEKNFDGVFLSENIKRFYPYGNLLTQVLGFTTIDNQGQAGVELFYDNYLKGIDGYSIVQSDIRGIELENTLRSYIPSIPGLNVTLTIDSKIQLETERAIEKLMFEQSAKSATAIVMSAKTGEILAMTTKPSFDLNNVPRNNIKNLMDMVKNKSVVDVYEPGSTFKILTMASVLEENLAFVEDGFYCNGGVTIGGERISCWKHSGHGSQNLIDGICNSCNVVFVELALRLGLEKFYQRLNIYGFGVPTGIEISGESGGIIMDKSLVRTVDLARMGFGQAVAVTPLQLICAVSAVVNGGTLFEPQLIKNITDVNGKVIHDFSITPVRKVVREDVSKTINMMLEETVSKPGKYTFIPGYEMGGKTGTTQKYENGKISGKYISSFIGTYPASNPEYVVLVMADEPGSGQYFGSIVASPYAKEIFNGIFEYKNFQPSHLDEAMQILNKIVVMPNLVGKSLTEATNDLLNIGLSYEIVGNGGIILDQLPPANSEINKAATIILIT